MKNKDSGEFGMSRLSCDQPLPVNYSWMQFHKPVITAAINRMVDWSGLLIDTQLRA
jgi:hypothetical protein